MIGAVYTCLPVVSNTWILTSLSDFKKSTRDNCTWIEECKMKRSQVLPPQWLESVVIGAGVLTILSSSVNVESIAALISVFVLGVVVQEVERVRGIELIAESYCRPHSNSGLLLGNILVPMVTTSILVRTDTTTSPMSNYYQATVVLLCMFTPVLLFICAVWKLNLITEYRLYHQLLIFPVFGLLTWSFWLRHKAVTLVVLVVTIPVTAFFFMTRLLYFLPRSFTLGEAVLVSESLTLLTMQAACSLTEGVGKLLACLQILVLGCVVMGVVVSPVAEKLQTVSHQHSPEKDKSLKDAADCNIKGSRKLGISHLKSSLYFYLCLAAAIIFILLPWLGFLLGQQPLLWGIFFVAASKTRMLLFCLWVLLVLGAVGVVTLLGSSSTVIRKYFHLLAVCIYVPGILFDMHLLHLASAGTFFIFIVLEFLRVFEVWPVGGILHDAFKVFLDSQDCGVAILTHIYLLLGMSLPVWLHMETRSSHTETSLALYSGVLSLGVGDTAASVVGSLYGKIRWPGSKKTLEGTCAAIASQLLASFLLICLDPRLSSSVGWMGITWVVCLTSVLEAVTTQIDNLVLPLFMYSLFTSL